MDMVGGFASGAHITNHLTLHHLLSHLYKVAGIVAIKRLGAVAMFDDDKISVTTIPRALFTHYHRARCRGE